MNELSFTALESGKSTVSARAVEAFAAQLRGGLLTAGDASHGDARKIWNAMIDGRPGLIAQCAEAAGASAAVRFAREDRLLAAVRGGGHRIDLSPMKSVKMDAATRRAPVEPGARLGDADKGTQAFVKQRCDPQNLFRMNQNVRPMAAA